MDMTAAAALHTHREVWLRVLPADARAQVAAGAQFTLIRDLYPLPQFGDSKDEAGCMQHELMRVLGAAVVASNTRELLDDLMRQAAYSVGLSDYALPGVNSPRNASWLESSPYLSQIDMMYMLRGWDAEKIFTGIDDDAPEVMYLSRLQRWHRHMAGWLLCMEESLITGEAGQVMATWGKAWLMLLEELRVLTATPQG